LKICDKYEIDPQEIDNEISYWENKSHLMSIVRELRLSGDVFAIENWAERYNQYREQHPIEYYLSSQTALPKPSEIAPVTDGKFSLREFIARQAG